MVLNVHRNHKCYYRDGEKGWGGGGYGGGEEGDYISIATLPPPK